MKRFARFLSLALLLPAAAKTIYVSVDAPAEYYYYDENEGRWYYDDNGRQYIDGEPGDRWENAYSSIGYACDEAEPGDTILVGPGTYDGFHVPSGKTLTVRSVSGADETILEGRGRNHLAFIVGLGKGDRLIGFTLQNSGCGVSGGLETAEDGSPVASLGRVEKCVIRNCGTDEILPGTTYGNANMFNGLAAEYAELVESTVENCFGPRGALEFCSLNRCVVRNNAGQEAGGLYRCIARNSLIAKNHATVRNPSKAWEGRGGGASGGEFVNCTIVENVADASDAGVASVFRGSDGNNYWIDNAYLDNCIVVNNVLSDGTVQNYSPAAMEGVHHPLVPHGSFFTYSCSRPRPLGTGNTETAPRFAEQSLYSLAAGSAGINAGNNACAYGNADLTGLPRVCANRVDMGATEYATSSEICTVHFDATGGMTDDAEGLFAIGSVLGTLPVPVREGWRFEGWFDDPDEERGDLVTAQTTARGRNMYLYAHWSEETDSVWQPVYRFYSKSYKGHFYTIDPEERATLMCTNPNWKYEGVAYYAATEQAQGTVPLHRFYSKNYRGHFYTIDEDEMWTVRNTNPNWRYEGVAFYVYPSRQADPSRTAAPIYRFWSKGYRHHFFTIDEDEMWDIRETNPNWKYESVAFYACEDAPGGGGAGSPPRTPTGIEAVALAGRRVSVSWDSVSGATGYRAIVHWTYYSGDGDEVDKSEEYELDETDLDLTFVAGDSGVWVEVPAVNDYGESEAGCSNQVDPAAGAGPSGIRATLSGSALRLTWTHAADARYYAVYVGGPRESDATGFPPPGVEYGTTTDTTFVIDPVPWYGFDAWFDEWGPVFYVYAYRDAGWSDPAVCWWSVD